MSAAIEQKYLSDVLNLERDIGEHRLIRLAAGVGAGKNSWTIGLANQGYSVLLITSRVATAQAQAKKMGADRWLDFDRLFDKDEFWDELPQNAQRKVVCTNAHIEKYVTQRFSAEDPKTHIWNKFDFIILDEAHSLTEDAPYTDAPFYVERFLKHAYKHSAHCRIIIMSGTQTPLDWLFAGQKNQEKVHTLDLFDKCTHVEPKRVVFYSQQDVLEEMVRQFRRGKRMIYFAVRIETISHMVKQLVESGVPEDCIGVSYSKDEKDSLFSEALIKRRVEIHESLITTERLPPNIKIWITTSRYKEGVNILDDDIPIMCAESHKHADLVQMAGRVRCGLKDLVVIYDAVQHHSRLSPFQEELNSRALESVRSTYTDYQEKLQRDGSEVDSKRLISEVHDMYPAIRYDPLREEFCRYRGRIQAGRQARHDHLALQAYIENYDAPVFQHGLKGREMLERWFPYSKISAYDKRELPKAEEKVRLCLEEKGYLDVVLDKKRRDGLIEELNSILKQCPLSGLPKGLKLPFKKLKPVLERYGYVYESIGKHGTKWTIRKAEESENKADES